MAGPGSYAHAVVGEAKSFDRAAHTVTIMENDLAPMAIVAFEIGLCCSDKIARDPSARADRAKIGHPGPKPGLQNTRRYCQNKPGAASNCRGYRGYLCNCRQESGVAAVANV